MNKRDETLETKTGAAIPSLREHRSIRLTNTQKTSTSHRGSETSGPSSNMPGNCENNPTTGLSRTTMELSITQIEWRWVIPGIYDLKRTAGPH